MEKKGGEIMIFFNKVYIRLLFVRFIFGFFDIQGKVEIFLEQREVAFLSPIKICENLNFSNEN